MWFCYETTEKSIKNVQFAKILLSTEKVFLIISITSLMSRNIILRSFCVPQKVKVLVCESNNSFNLRISEINNLLEFCQKKNILYFLSYSYFWNIQILNN